MIVTEELAKTKRCQESYAATSVSPTGHMVTISANSTGLIATAPSMCIGSACMAWRFLTRLDESATAARPAGQARSREVSMA
jgi:hypothetical protein